MSAKRGVPWARSGDVAGAQSGVAWGYRGAAVTSSLASQGRFQVDPANPGVSKRCRRRVGRRTWWQSHHRQAGLQEDIGDGGAADLVAEVAELIAVTCSPEWFLGDQVVDNRQPLLVICEDQ